MKRRVLISCEHGGNRVPARYRSLFAGCDALLQTHRGWDAGALLMARTLARGLRAPLFASTISRLVVDLNRSPGHPRLFSEMIAGPIREEVLERYYRPFRDQVERRIAASILHGHPVVHISSHSFTPELDGTRRNADIGLLYDPARSSEVELCRRWQKVLQLEAPALKVRRNYPYSGTSDGFNRALRMRFPERLYAGVELEVNQKHFSMGTRHWRALCQTVLDAARRALGDGFRFCPGPSRAT